MTRVIPALAPTLAVFTAVPDIARGQVTLFIPGSFATVLQADLSGVEIWRSRGPLPPGAGGPDEDLIAVIPPYQSVFIDRAPNRTQSTYRIYPARFDGSLGSPQDVTVTTTLPMRPDLESPFNTLELSVRHGCERLSETAFVETAPHVRFPVSGQATYELVVDYAVMSTLPNVFTINFEYGFRWYRKNGEYLGRTYNTEVCSYQSANPRRVKQSIDLEPVPGAQFLGIFLKAYDYGSLSGIQHYTRIRIERLELYRKDPETRTGWKYVPVPDSSGRTINERLENIDLTAFSYDGVGWGPVTAPPSVEGQVRKAPYRETTTVDDEISFIISGQWVDVIFYGSLTTTQVEVSKLADSSMGHALASQGDDILWEPISGITGQCTELLGPNLIQFGDMEAGTPTFYGSAYSATTPPTGPYENGLSNPSPQTAIRTNINPISGTWSLLAPLDVSDMGLSFTMLGQTFIAGRTYRASITLKKQRTDQSRNLRLIFGTSDPKVTVGNLGSISPTLVDMYATDQVIYNVSVIQDANVHTYTLEWTPRADTNTAYFAILATNPTQPAPDDVTIDDVSVRELLGVELAPVANELDPVVIRIPSHFSTRNATPYRISLIQGKMRPYSLRRDTQRTLDLVYDFDTVLRALGNMRNASEGELELRADVASPTIYHHTRRGIDHRTTPGGMDLRIRKNITARKRTTDSTNLTNRLIIVGYGDDRTQLVTEVRSLKDVQGRLPSDPFHRYDKNDLPKIITNQLLNSSFDNPAGSAGWQRVGGGTGSFVTLPGPPPPPNVVAGYVGRFQGGTGGTFDGVLLTNVGPYGLYPSVTPGESISLSAYIDAENATAVPWAITAFFYNDALTLISTVVGTPVLAPAFTWVRPSLQTIVPNGATKVNIQIATSGGVIPNGQWVYITGVEVTKSSKLLDYVDIRTPGATADALGYPSALNPSWDRYTGGTSEDVYGPRYGVHRDPNLTSLYQALETGTLLVEQSAWPAETFDVSVVDLSPLDIRPQPGDIIAIKYQNQDIVRRVQDVTNDISKPNEINMTIGDDVEELSKIHERISRDVDTVLSFVSAQSNP